ncbi:nucleotide-binding oligomerization domain-containing protein 1-like [Odontesthes bonariensis]|uniref:nucleotide-binding oligomerization domain-containing protein 1-like n=1 Tax=Odontesthes bonariensis TaxID=219752 RepID=UPI003F58FA77
MACTSQSAREYVTNARADLVEGLKGLPLILENLNQKGVLHDEEVSKIQAEKDNYDRTRAIVDHVIKKGEEACYELLGIIATTRDRTLGRPPCFPENKSDASHGKMKLDLHHWISCFSFKEDTLMEGNYFQGPRPCRIYQKKLKSQAQKLSKEFWVASKRLFEENKTPDLSYTSLVLDTQAKGSPSKIKKLKRKKSNMSRPTKLRTYIPEAKQEISPSGLLKKDEDMVLVGKPGIGKTALTREMLRVWAERDNNELDYMFYFDMRNTAHFTPAMSLEDLLFNVYSEPDEGRDEVLQDIKKNSDKVTIIFDGLTELSPPVVQKLAEKDLLPDSKIIITCRPDDEEDFFFEDPLTVEVKGFSEPTIKTYLSATLGEDHKKVLSRVELLTLCHVPMYALMVAACFSSEDSPQPATITEIYINIVRFCLQMSSNRTRNKNLNQFIRSKRKEILSLAEAAFIATEGKTVNLPEVQCEDRCVLSFLKPLVVKVAPTESITTHAFLHYTMQEFFAALWLLKNPDGIRKVFQQSLTEDMKHMKHLIPLMCRLLNQKSPSLMSCLIPAEELSNTSEWFFKEMIATFFPVADTEDRGPDVPLVFLCQCLYESQCPEACSYLLDELGYCLDLSGENLDPYSCCAVAFVVTQSKERKIRLNVADVTASELGMRRLLGCFENVQRRDLLLQQLWKIFLLSEEQMDYEALLGLDGNQLHLPVCGEKQLFERAVEVMQRMSTKVNVCLYWDRAAYVCQSLCESLLQAMPSIGSLSFRMTDRGPGLQNKEKHTEMLVMEKERLFLDICLKTTLHYKHNLPSFVNKLLSLFPLKTDMNKILYLYQHFKSEGFSDVIPNLKPLFQSAAAVWFINLSERKSSILLEVLKLQSEKKQVELTGCPHEESEVRSFLQCLPYISQLR